MVVGDGALPWGDEGDELGDGAVVLVSDDFDHVSFTCTI